MYHSWLDCWDERRAQRGEEAKNAKDFSLNAELAFPGAGRIESIDEFCVLADQAVADHSFFDVPQEGVQQYRRREEWLTFPSDITTDIDENNVVWAKITESGSLNHALVVFHHWNARERNSQLARVFSKCGITVIEIAMPYCWFPRRTEPVRRIISIEN